MNVPAGTSGAGDAVGRPSAVGRSIVKLEYRILGAGEHAEG